jgi:acetyl esterase
MEITNATQEHCDAEDASDIYCQRLHTAVVLLILFCSAVLGQPERPLDSTAAGLRPTRMLTSMRADGLDLKMHVFEPTGHLSSHRCNVFMTFLWRRLDGGKCTTPLFVCRLFSTACMVSVSVDYRWLWHSDKSTVFDCVRDGRSAVRHLRLHGAEPGIDPQCG